MERLVGMVPVSQVWKNSCLLSLHGGVEARLDLEKCLGGYCNVNSQIVTTYSIASSLVLR